MVSTTAIKQELWDRIHKKKVGGRMRECGTPIVLSWAASYAPENYPGRYQK